MQIIVPAIIGVALLLWFLTDRVVYKGNASVIANNMKHYSTTHKTVMVVPHKTVGGGILVATVTNAKAADIAASALSTRQITVRQRIFGKPRVTSVS